MKINNQEDWWNLLNKAWDGIINTCYELNFNLGQPATDDLLKNGNPIGCTIWEDMENAKKSKNSDRLLRYLNAFWNAAPDDYFIHSLPNWGDLCDLCSESWVFEEEE